jgi:hypothetical protein
LRASLPAQTQQKDFVMVSTVNPIATLEIILEGCGAYPDQLVAMRALVKMIKDEHETLVEGVISLDPDFQLAREAELLDEIADLKEKLRALEQKAE